MSDRWWFGGTVALGLAAAVFTPGCTIGYLVQSGVHQAGLLLARRPVDVVIGAGRLSPEEEAQLRLVPEIKAFGRTLGLSATHNYDTFALGWDHTIWNLSASEPFALEPRTWWFPVVGRVPYLGFFTDREAERWRTRLEAEGLDVWQREAGAYSTLGWFRDPVLPQMLRWDEATLAETVLHELAHATLWIPGSVSFNETFASVVGEEAGHRYLVAKYGAGSPQVADAEDAHHDWTAWRALLSGLRDDLDAVYRDPALRLEDKSAKKAEIFASLPERVDRSDLRRKERYRRAAETGPWNNARIAQFQTYNTHEDWFRAVLAHEDGDVLRFITAIRTATAGADDPVAALGTAVQKL